MKMLLLWLALLQLRLTLPEAVDRAMHANPTLLRQAQLAEAARAGADRVESDLYPHLGLEGVVKDGPPGAPNFSLRGLGNAGFPQSAGGDLILTHTFDFGRTSQKLVSQRFSAEAAGDDRQSERARVILNVERAYARVLLAEELLRLADETIQSYQQIADQARARFRAGLVSRVDAGLAGAELAQARADRAELAGQRETAVAGLFAAMGANDVQPVELEPLAAQEWTVPPDQDLPLALEHRPELRAVRAQVGAARAAVLAAEAGHNPYLSFYAAGGYIRDINGPQSSPNSFGVGMALSVPLYTAGGVEAEVDQAEHQLQAALARQEEVSQTVRLQVEEAEIRLTTLKARRSAFEEQVTAALDGSRLARTRYQLGLGNIVELQQAELARLKASTNLIRNRAELWLAQAELTYATGKENP